MNNSLQRLVFGADRVDGLLLQTGSFPSNWVSEYCHALDRAMSELPGQNFWPKSLFQAMRFVSFYLPIRYSVWHQRDWRQNRQTEFALNELRFRTEEWLWKAFGEGAPLESDASLTDNDRSLIDLCFGRRCPLGRGADRGLFEAWDSQYIAFTAQVRATWDGKSEWPMRMLVAIHYASLYMDLFRRRTVRLRKAPASGPNATAIEQLLSLLRERIRNPSALAVIRLMLQSPCLPCDCSGLPAIEEQRLPPRHLGSVRTLSEVALLHDSPSG